MNPIQYFLAKTDPESYSVADLERDGKTVWDGVKNPQALRAIWDMRPGDKVFIYHSQGKPEVVGLAKVISAPRTDPKYKKGAVVELDFLARFEPPVSLREIKESALFDEWALVKQSRLSTMHAPEAFAEWMRGKYPQTKV